MGQHHMDVCGHGTDIGRDPLLRLAHEGDVSRAYALATIDAMRNQASRFATRTGDYPIRRATVLRMSKAIDAASKQLA